MQKDVPIFWHILLSRAAKRLRPTVPVPMAEGPETVYFAILRDVVVIADGLVTFCQVTGFQIFEWKLTRDFRRRAMNHIIKSFG